MLNFSLALPIRLRLGSKGETAKSSKDPSKAALISRDGVIVTKSVVQHTAAEIMDFWRRGLVHLEKL